MSKAAHISVLAELEALHWDPVLPLSDDEVKTRCPLHEDHTPSCTINLKTLLFYCHASQCNRGGDFITFMAAVTKTNRATVFADLSKRYDLEQVKAINPEVIEREHAAIWDQKHLLKELYLRGVTDSSIRKYRLGFNDGRVTIPIKNDGGVFVNIRYYLPGAPGAKKFKNASGRGKPVRLFPVDQMDYDDVVLCGGEVKAVVGAQQLNARNIGCVSGTAGEGAKGWTIDLTKRFAGKRVWICMDIDEAGQKASDVLATILRPVVRWIGIIKLPLDKDKYPKGDLNDFVAKENGELWSLLEGCSEWHSPIDAPTIEDYAPIDTKFSETILSINVGKRMAFESVVSAAMDKPFVVPKRVLVDCDKSQECCTYCGIFPQDKKTFHVAAESPAILQMIDVPLEKMDSALRAALAIPRRCEVVRLSVEDHYNAWDVRVNPSLEITNRDTERTMQHAVCIDCDADLNTTYKFIGRMWPHPKTQAATLLLSKSVTTYDSLSKYQPQDLPALRMFRPPEWTVEGLQERLDELYTDLETHVTKIFLRRDIHVMVDLAYHSALIISVDGKKTKGWAEVLIVGDSANGKSETVEKLLQHYQLGEIVPCKNVSVAGLLGGLKQMGSQWYVSWGVIPQHDRRLVVLEELKGARVEVIASLTDMRSSGVAQTTKIEKRRSPARTRLIAVSNPRSERKMASYAFGLEVIRELIGAPEDVRRFDACLIVADGEINSRELNHLVRNPPKVKHEHTSDLCKELILWAWTRTEEQVVIAPETATEISDAAGRLTDEFCDDIPIVDKGSMRHKISRLAVALAMRTFSTTSDELVCLVRPCHAQYIEQLLRRVYSSSVFGYKFYSEATRATVEMIDAPQIESYIKGLAFPEEFIEQMLYNDDISINDVQDWTGLDREQGSQVISLLTRKRAIKRKAGGRNYAKTPQFIALLKRMEIAPVPKHLREAAKADLEEKEKKEKY